MNRFTRLVQLRKVREEALAMTYGQVQTRLVELHKQLGELDQTTIQGQEHAREDIPLGSARLAPEIYANYLQGQSWRRQKLLQTIEQTKLELEAARAAWHYARVQSQQVEKLAGREDKRLDQLRRHKEMIDLDQSGILGHMRDS